jgi:hypothetical protein
MRAVFPGLFFLVVRPEDQTGRQAQQGLGWPSNLFKQRDQSFSGFHNP